MAKRTQSPLQKAYNKLRKTKSKVCKGEATKAVLKLDRNRYVAEAVRAGQTKKEALQKANRIANGGCTVSTRVSGTKKRKTTARKRKK